MRAEKAKSLLVSALALCLSLSCTFVQSLGQRGTPVPAPVTEIPAVNLTAEAALTAASRATPTGTAGPTQDASGTPAPEDTPAVAETTVPGALPHLEAGQPLDLTAINMLDEIRGWGLGQPAAGDTPAGAHQHVLVTEDGGLTWRDVSPPQPAGGEGVSLAASAFFLDEDNAWAAFYDANTARAAGTARVWVTRDGGGTWTASEPLDLSDVEGYVPSDMIFVTDRIGWLMAHAGAGMGHDYVLVFATRDAGQTWERVADPFTNTLAMSCQKNNLGFLNERTGWVTGDCFGVAPGVYFQRTDDGGLTWAEQLLPAPTGMARLFESPEVGCGTYSLTLLPPQAVRVAVSCNYFLEDGRIDNYLYASDDGGQTWSIDPLPGRTMAFLNPDVGWSLAGSDVNDPAAARLLSRTSDGGDSWAEIGTVFWDASFDFVTQELGWAVARSGEDLGLVQSTDGGATWQLLEPRSAP